jgi:hypothetical protein
MPADLEELEDGGRREGGARGGVLLTPNKDGMPVGVCNLGGGGGGDEQRIPVP